MLPLFVDLNMKLSRLQIMLTIVFNIQFPVDPWTNYISTNKAQITLNFSYS